MLISEKIIIPLAVRQSRAASFIYFMLNLKKKGACCRGNDPGQALESAPDPVLPSRYQLVESFGRMRNAPKGKENCGGFKKKGKKGEEVGF